ncbi:hypothetical protein K6Y31_15895 [Motilimonas cestriensis]|uniref:DUF3096 domain-containing protein n=1 Tax=Motilimonas cestriensis TaxID=2742685 RepID=A0ABS8WFF4_9GAMM|nr:hypothetical protein [Motilimonas cestriensis]MCE2596284.1 hypothetical protein [Motilimonas cestriensis]
MNIIVAACILIAPVLLMVPSMRPFILISPMFTLFALAILLAFEHLGFN